MSSNYWNNKIRIFTTIVDNISLSEGEELLLQFLQENCYHRIHTANPEIVMAAKRDGSLTELLNGADLVTADGIGLIMAAEKKGHPLKERVTGVDLSYYLLRKAQEEGRKVFLLGGKEGVAGRAAHKILEEYPGIGGVFFHHGYFKGSHLGYENTEEEADVIDQINESEAEILFVGLGFPKQEIWMSAQEKNLHHVKVAIGNGGVIDLLAGDVKRAPEIFIKMNLEWFYRLIQDPKRIKRQMVIPKFMSAISREQNAVEEINKEEL